MRPLVVALFFLVLVSAKPLSAEHFSLKSGPQPCRLANVMEVYDLGLRAYDARQFRMANALWTEVAKRGFQPAARRKAMLLSDPSSGIQDIEKALFWSIVGAHGRDRQSIKLEKTLYQKISPATRKSVIAEFEAWSPALSDCQSGLEQDRRLDDFSFVSRHGFDVAIDPRLGLAAANLVYTKFSQIIDLALEAAPMAALYIKMIERAEVYKSDRYHRFLRFKPDDNHQILQLSIGNFLDTSPEYAAKAIAYEAIRHVYRRIGDPNFADPYVKRYRGKTLVGSVYPDANNQEFFRMMKQVIDLGMRLPTSEQNIFRVIDEVHYTPHSKYFAKAGVIDRRVAYYNRRWSYPGRRVIFLRRDVLFSSVADMLLSVIHEGAHVMQHLRAIGLEAKISEKREELESLEKLGQGHSREASLIRTDLERMETDFQSWKGVITEDNHVMQDIRFECEATMVEIKTAKAIGAPPRMVEKSQYVKLCNDAQIAIVRWREGLRSGATR